MGALCSGQGDRQKGLKLLMEALEVYQDIGDTMLGSFVMVDNSWETWKIGHLLEARRLMEEYLEDQRKSHFRWAISTTLGGLIGMALTTGDYPAAQQYSQENYEIRRALNMDSEIAWSQYDLGKVAYALGDLATAQGHLEAALETFQKYKDKFAIGLSLNLLGMIAVFRGRVTEGMAQLDEALAVNETTKNPMNACKWENLLFQGRVACQLGYLARAGELIYQSLENIWTEQDVSAVPGRLEGMAAVALGQARYRDGALLLGAASRQRQAMNAPLYPVEQPAYERVVQGLRVALGEAQFQDAWDQGAAMSVAESVVYALEVTREARSGAI